MKWRLSILFHDCIAHPIAGLLWLFKIEALDAVGHTLHDYSMYRCPRCANRFDDFACPKCGWAFERVPESEREG